MKTKAKPLIDRVKQDLSDLLPGHSQDDYHVAALCVIASVSMDSFLKTVGKESKPCS